MTGWASAYKGPGDLGIASLARGGLGALALACGLGCGPPVPTAPAPAPAAVVELTPAPQPAPTLDTCRVDDEATCAHACEAGDAESCARLAAIALELHGQAERAAELFARACQHGSGKGCNGLGVLKQRDTLGAADPQAAATHYQRACEMDYAGGCYNLAQLHMHVLGETEKGIAGYRHACDRGSADGCAEMGALLLEGTRLPRDLEAAEALLERGCRGDVGRACHNLSLALRLRGEEERAAEMRARACKLGNAPSCAPPEPRPELTKD